MNNKLLQIKLLASLMLFFGLCQFALANDRPLLPYTGSPVWVPEICDNGIDDDGDGLVDAADPDCAGQNSSIFLDLGHLTDYLFVFTNGSVKANWMGTSKGYAGDVAFDANQASESTSLNVPYAGNVFSNKGGLDNWGNIVSKNDPPEVSPAQAFAVGDQVVRVANLEIDLANAFAQIEAMTPTAGFTSVAATALNGMNTQNGIPQFYVINVTSGFDVTTPINITGDADDVFVLRWDTNGDPANGYQGQVKFSLGGGIVPLGDLKPSNFIHVAGDLAAAGGGTTPAPPYPQGPRLNDGTGALVTSGSDFAGGGFFTGYWLTKGIPSSGKTSTLTNANFVGGWYTTSTDFSLSTGTSGVHVSMDPTLLSYSEVCGNGLDDDGDDLIDCFDPDCGAGCDHGCIGAAGDFVLLALNGGSMKIQNGKDLYGSVGYCSGVSSSETSHNSEMGDQGVFTGAAYVHTSVSSFKFSSTFLPSGGIVRNNATVSAHMDQANADALASSAYFAGQIPHLKLGTIVDNQVIYREDTLTVIEIAEVDYVNKSLELIGQAGGDDAFIINVLGDFAFDRGEIILTNVRPERVVFNFPNESGIDIGHKDAIFKGTILAPLGDVTAIEIEDFVGAIVAKDIDVNTDFIITHAPLDIHACDGEICTNGIDDDGDGLVDCDDPQCGPTVNSHLPIDCNLTSTISEKFENFPLNAGDYIWFSSQGQLDGSLVPPATVYIAADTIRFSANGTDYEVPVPAAVVHFSEENVDWTTTSYDAVNQRWITNVSLEHFGSQLFLTGVAFQVPAGGLPAEIDPVTWNLKATTDQPGLGFNWTWGAAVYTNFTTNPKSTGVKPVDDNAFNPYKNNYKAAVPVHYVSHLVPGGTGNGGNKYTGNQSGSETALACRTYFCESPFEICNNGLDDDGDGLEDCADPDCGGQLTAFAGADVEICKDNFAALGAIGNNGATPYTYTWSDEGDNDFGNTQVISVNPNSTIDYIVTVTSATGCSATSSVEVKVNPLPKVNAGSNATVCSGVATILTPSTSGGSGGNTYFWDNGVGAGQNPTVYPTVNTTYSVTVTDSKGCTDVDDKDVDVVSRPSVYAGADTIICKGFNANLTASASGGEAPYTYLWNNSAGVTPSVSVAPTSTKTYIVTVTGDNGCIAKDTVVVTVDNTCPEICGNGLDDDDDGKIDCADSDCGPQVNAGGNKTICVGASYVLVATAQGGPLPHVFSWDQGLGLGASKPVTPAVTTTYTVTVTAASGCTDVDDITINISACTEDCYNGVDDDGDGKVDCKDSDCMGITVPVLIDDEYYSCPGSVVSERVTYNDANLLAPVFTIESAPDHGMVTINATGKFTYTPFNYDCQEDEFEYEVCNTTTGCCEKAKVTIYLQDLTPPTLTNVPADLTISCDDELPEAEDVVGFDDCSGLYIDFEETSTEYTDGICEGYSITRTWQATDLCGNVTVETQTIVIEDLTPPELFRVYTMPNGKKLLAGISQRASNYWKYVPYPIVFEETPVVFSQVISNEEAATVVVQQQYVSKSGFELRLVEQEADDQKHQPEQVAWLAMEPGAFGGDTNLEAGMVSIITSAWTGITLGHSFGGTPSFILSAQTVNEEDPFTIRTRNAASSGVEIKLQEETSSDVETAHVAESVAYLAIDQYMTLLDEADDFVGESGQLTLSNAWTTINLTNTYYKPVVITGGLTYNNGDPATIRVRNVTAHSFEVRAEEWPYLDGVHPAETTAYVVVEGGLPGNVDLCSGGQNNIVKGENLFVRDNCDSQLELDYVSEDKVGAMGEILNRSWYSIDDCGNTLDILNTDTCAIAAVRLRAMLQGAVMQNGGSTLMRDDLRAIYQVPTREPFSNLPGFYQVETNDDLNDVPIPAAAQQATYRTIANGDWVDSDTWLDGNVPPTGDIDGKTISVEHKVTLLEQMKLGLNSVLYLTNKFLEVESSKFEIKEGAQVIVTNAELIIKKDHLEIKEDGKLYVTGGRLVVTDGDLKIYEGTVCLTNSIYGNGHKGKIEMKEPTSVLTMTGCMVNLGEDFRNESGTRKLVDVQLNVGEDFVAEHDAVDTLINVTAVIGKKFEVKSNSTMHLVDCKIHVVDGDFSNDDGCVMSGSGLTVWVEDGKLENDDDGIWTATVDEYCVSDEVTVPPLMMLNATNCSGLSTFFTENTISALAESALMSLQDTITLPVEQINTGRLDPMILEIQGEKAVVDWMFIELRDGGDDTKVVATATTALQRNGNIMSNIGDNVIYFPKVPEGDYYIVLRHRNHLGVMTDVPYFLSTENSPQVFDFADPALPLRGGLTAGHVVNGQRTMWAGDFNGDGNVIFQGPYNDIFHLFSHVLSDADNVDNLANHISTGYDSQDYNMDGKTIYQGPNNEKAMLLYYSILFHPDNVAMLANFIAKSSLP